MSVHELTEVEYRKSGRVLVYVVAYRAERHIETLFERVPRELLNADRVHFLVIDDAGGDAENDLVVHSSKTNRAN